MSDRLLTYAELSEILPNLVTPRRLLQLARDGHFVDYVRLTPRGPALWPEAAVRRWLAEKVGALGVME